jgi:hypothetical protein
LTVSLSEEDIRNIISGVTLTENVRMPTRLAPISIAPLPTNADGFKKGLDIGDPHYKKSFGFATCKIVVDQSGIHIGVPRTLLAGNNIHAAEEVAGYDIQQSVGNDYISTARLEFEEIPNDNHKSCGSKDSEPIIDGPIE